MAKKTVTNGNGRTASKALATVAKGQEIILFNGRHIPVTGAVREAESQARKALKELGSAFLEFGRRILDVAHEMMPAFSAWQDATGINGRGAVDAFLSRLDPQYVAGQREAGSYSLSLRNRWLNMERVYAEEQARLKIAEVADVEDPAARQTMIDAVDGATKRAMAKLENVDPETRKVRDEILGVQSDDTTERAPRISATDARNALVRTVLALIPADMHGTILDKIAKRLDLSGAALTRFNTEARSVDPWLKCKQVADGVAYVAPKPQAEPAAAPQANQRRGNRRQLAVAS